MTETYELRLKTEFADRMLGDGWQTDPHCELISEKTLKVSGVVGDEVYMRARAVHKELIQSHHEFVTYSCRIERTYSKKEINAAELFLVLSFYQYGASEEYGTWYTDAMPNPACGSDRQELRIVSTSPFRSVVEDKKNLTCALGSRQVGPLHYPFGKLTKRDLISLWGGETVISERLAKLIEDGGFRGGTLEPVWNTTRGAKTLPALAETPSGAELIARAESLGLKISDQQFWSWLESKEQLPEFERALWEEKSLAKEKRAAAPTPNRYFQLKVESSPLAVAEPTVLNDPFFGGLQHHCKCDYGEIHGSLNSCLYVKRSSWDGSDICQTDIFFGGRQGLFRPYRQLIVSKGLFDAMKQSRVTRVQFEIVELV